ncbi:MAG: archaellin/type IV pilin N-terminal domain-containing protein [Candidatus Aenigmatarchaeota archaeon]
MKGISPIVAAVLLIAITMTIAGVLAYWSSTFISTTLPTENVTTAQCRVAQFEFRSCRYNSTSQTITFSLENVRSIELSNLTAFIEYSNNTVSSGIPLNQSLPPATIKSYAVSGISPDFSKIIIKTTNCPELSRSDVCTR